MVLFVPILLSVITLFPFTPLSVLIYKKINDDDIIDTNTLNNGIPTNSVVL
jgi:hypothetical protein